MTLPHLLAMWQVKYPKPEVIDVDTIFTTWLDQQEMGSNRVNGQESSLDA